ncbi:hypothetical protein [Leptolyngbya sp. NIES-2104]|uniref:hypothetical protein n=1 Tax=Leptolyngbya sp. NIES-2104 TaxID=1552121 RepID=UPI0006EC88D8|nr:hypothetical protein [Leptolyngbya sp. NIES-2104]GAP95700.1 hypothetical protein NIES2104_22240 [Leptolyngbya sp. NIES-2104]
MARSKRLNSLLLYCVVGIMGVFVGFHPTLLSGFSKAQAETGDTRLVHYFLEHSFQVVFNRNYHAQLWSPAFFFPFKNTLALSENLFGAAPFYWLLRGVLPADLAYQCWMILAALLCFVSFVILLRNLRVSHSLAAFGGFVFAFGIPRMAQLFHSQLLCQFYTPIAFIFIWTFLQQPKLNQLCFALLFIFLQILAAYYHGWFLLFSLLIFVPIVLWLEREYWKQLLQFLKVKWRSTIVAILIWSGALIWLFLPYVQMVKIVGGFPFSQVATMIPRLSSWFLPPPNSLWFPLLSRFSKDILDPNQHLLFPGFVVFALVGFAVYVVRSKPEILPPERSTLVKACLITALILFVLSLDVFGVSLWRIIYTIVPGATAIRATGRIVYIIEVYVLIAGLLCVDSMLKSIVVKPKFRSAIALFLLLISLPELIIFQPITYEKAPILKLEAELQAAIASRCEVAYLVADPRQPIFYLQQLPIMWAGLKAGVPVVNGYSGSTPPGIPTTIADSANFTTIVRWLSGKMQGRLCWIQPGQSQQIAPEISLKSIDRAVQFQSQNFTTSVIPIPPNVPLPGFAQAIEGKVPRTMRSNQAITVPLFVSNTSLYTWFQPEEAPIRLSYRWLKPDGTIAVSEGPRTNLPDVLRPGETVALNAIVNAPTLPGQYRLSLTLLQENISWFVDRGAKPLTVPVEIIR